MDKITGFFLLIVSALGSFAVFAAVQRFFSPRDNERSPMSDISDMEGKETSVFNKLEDSKNFWDKVDLFMVRNMKQGKKLEENYRQKLLLLDELRKSVLKKAFSGEL